jgi:hypothetical protein
MEEVCHSFTMNAVQISDLNELIFEQLGHFLPNGFEPDYDIMFREE